MQDRSSKHEALMLNVNCACGTQLSLPDEWAGRKGKCPACGEVLAIPAPSPPAESLPAATARPIPPPGAGSTVTEKMAPAAPTRNEPAVRPESSASTRPPAPGAKPSSAATRAAQKATPADARQAAIQTAVVQKPEKQSSAAPAASAAIPSPARRAASEPVERHGWIASLLARPKSARQIGAGVAVLVAVGAAIAVSGFLSGDREPEGSVASAPDSSSDTRDQSRAPTENSAPAPTAVRSSRPPVVESANPPLSPIPAPAPAPAVNSPNSSDPGELTRPVPVRPPRSSGGLTAASREYDDPHCQQIQMQHAVRIPPSAKVLEVDGLRLPIANVEELAASPAPYLFLPRGEHAVRFRLNESPLPVTIRGDLAGVYQEMRQFFAVEGKVREYELASRGAKAMDVHAAPFLLNFMGASHQAGGRWEAAERKFRRALRVNPLFSPAHLNLAWCLHRRGARQEAAAEVELADATNVGNSFGLAGAISELRRQYGLTPARGDGESLTVASYLGTQSLSEEDRRLTALMQGIAKYAVSDSERGKILNNLAVHFADTGQTDLALDHFRASLGVLRLAGPERFALAGQVLSHMSAACRKAGYEEADEYDTMKNLVRP
jgi:tetratricopeptide (TPR) repeat protein